jgi:K+/H+ antiporter YhaU regulatory subunit KhtT
MIQVQHKLIKRQKHHLITLESIGIILANNGNIFLSAYRRSDPDQNPSTINIIDKQIHKSVAKISNLLRVLAVEGLEISELVLKELIAFVNDREIATNDILVSGELKEELLERVR